MYEHFLQTANKVVSQQKDSKGKVYSIHEPHVYCIAKGKEAKKYEYGCKVNIVWGKSGLIMGANHLKENIHDSKVIAPALEQYERLHGYLPKEVVADKGYRGKTQIKGGKVSSPNPPSGKVSKYQKSNNRKKFRKRAGIEPIIAHLKSDFRLSRNFLKGVVGDRHNLMMDATAFNFRKWIVKYQQLIKSWLYTFIQIYQMLTRKKFNQL